MVKTKKWFCTLFACLMAFLMFMEAPVQAFAATSSKGTQTRTITVVTKANWWKPGSESITLSQTKGVRVDNVFSWGKWKEKEKKDYGTWEITAKSTDGTHTVKKTLKGSSIKLNLKPDKTYIVTVSWNSVIETINAIDKGTFKTYPSWRVKSGHKCTYY